MSTSNIIPDTVLGLGPQFQRLPRVLIVKIFKMALQVTDLPPYESSPGTILCLDAALERGFNHVAAVCRSSQALALELIYDANTIEFLCTGSYRKPSQFRTTMPPDMPHFQVRNLLRHIHVEFVFEDGYLAGHPANYSGISFSTRPARIPITTVGQLMLFSPSAAWFSMLTQTAVGFSNLDSLSIDIIVDVRNNRQTALQIFQNANFSVHANSVRINIKNRQGVREDWHSSLDQAIARV